MIAFMKRNIKLYLRDKAGVGFSLLAVFIVIGLYVLFLGDVYANDLKHLEYGKEMMDAWVMAGVLAITSMTTTLGILGTVVRDKEQGLLKDFYVAPLRKWKIASGYLLSSYLVGVVMSLIALVVAEIYIVSNGGDILSAQAMIKVLGMILLTSFMNTAIMLFIVSFLKSMAAFSTVSTIIGTLIGFLTGIYLPIGMLLEPVKWIIKGFPVSHAAVVFRNIMMEDTMAKAFENVPTDIILDVKESLGVVYFFGDRELSIGTSVIIVGVVGVVFLVAAIMKMKKQQK